ncbi:alpha/beta fold hydrolase [Tumebacillus lipolyticus]|uniref:Alpha/beta fold hydrolase n=1 Tax=Tumebacillus lipolyticus TaxID=1280370 RepID=A0ABW4ZWT2_9BACL
MTTTNLHVGYFAHNGTEIYYETMGEGHPLVLIHGVDIDCRMWDSSFAALSHTFKVIRFDLRGFGKTKMTADPFSFFDDLNALLQHLGIEQTYVCGLSFGGYLALEFTLAHPEKVEKLVLCASALLGHPLSPQRELAKSEFIKIVQSGDVERGIEENVQQWLYGPGQTGERIAPEVSDLFRAMSAHAFSLPDAHNMPRFIDPPVIERLGEISAETLVLTGGLDYIDFAQIAQKLTSELQQATHIELPNTAHLFPMEVPKQFTKLLSDFLK